MTFDQSNIGEKCSECGGQGTIVVPGPSTVQPIDYTQGDADQWGFDSTVETCTKCKGSGKVG